MDLDAIIDELQDYCFDDKETISNEKEMFDNYQIEFLDGFIGIIVNHFTKTGKYEVYLNIKSKNKIVCPLLYKMFNNLIEAKSYYEKLKKLIDNNNEKNIINHCKIGL